MRKKINLNELINENKNDLIRDREELERITEKAEEKLSNEKND